MAVPESRGDAYRITKIISVLSVVVLCFASMFLLAGTNPELDKKTSTYSDGIYHITLEYNTDMSAGDVKFVISDGSASETHTVIMNTSGRTLTCDIKSNIADGDVTMESGDSVVISTLQLQRMLILVFVMAPLTVIALMLTIRSFTTSVKEYRHGEDEIVLCNGIVNHELYVNDELISQTKTWVPFMKGFLGGLVNEKRIKIYISPMNAVTLTVNGETVEEHPASAPAV